MKKFLKFLGAALVLAAVALTLVFTVSAEDDEPILSVNGASLTLTDGVYLTYSMKIENADPDKVELLIWLGAQESYEKGTEREAAKQIGYDETYGEYRFRFSSQVMKEMAEEVYARPYVEIDGVETYGEVVKYSVLEYCLKNTDASLAGLLSAVRSLGAEAQKYFKYNTDRLATDVHYLVKIEGGTFSDGFTKAVVKSGDTFTIKADPAPDGMLFSKWVDGDGYVFGDTEEITVNVFENTTITAQYESIFTFDDKNHILTGLKDGVSVEHLVIPATTPEGSEIWEIAEGAFKGHTEIKSVEILADIATVECETFSGCTSLESVILPGWLRSINERAFYDCHALRSVTLPSSVYLIETGAFGNCYSLAEVRNLSGLTITVGSEENGKIAAYASVVYTDDTTPSELVVDKNGFVLHTEGEETVLVGYRGTATDITVPNGVTVIKPYSFAYNDRITSVVIPEGVKTIGARAFYSCSSLTRITFPESVSVIENETCRFCTSLFFLEIPEGVVTIGERAFDSCYSLASVAVPSTLKVVGNAAFDSCFCLVEVWNFSALSLEKGTYGYGKVATNALVIHTSSSDDRKVKISSGFLVYDGKTLVRYIIGRDRAVIPDGITEINSYCFYGDKTIKTLIIPDTVTKVGQYAFYEMLNGVEILCEAESQPAGWSSQCFPYGVYPTWRYTEY